MMNGNQGTLLRQCGCSGWKKFVPMNNKSHCQWCGKQLAMKEVLYILCAAIHYDDGLKHDPQPRNIERGFVIAGRRHHNCILTFALLNPTLCDQKLENTQGFITSTDLFVNRSVAYEIAANAGQIEHIEDSTRCLLSEMVW